MGHVVFRSELPTGGVEPAMSISADGDLGWRALPGAARIYVVTVIATGADVVAAPLLSYAFADNA